MEEILKNKYAVKGTGLLPEEARLLSLLSGGRPGWALTGDLIKKRDRLFNDFSTLLHGIEEDLWEDRDAMLEWFHWAQLWLRDIAVFKATGRTDLLINQDKEKEIKIISDKTDLKNILNLSANFYNIKTLLNFNLNKQLTLYHTYLMLKKTFSQEGTNA